MTNFHSTCKSIKFLVFRCQPDLSLKKDPNLAHVWIDLLGAPLPFYDVALLKYRR